MEYVGYAVIQMTWRLYMECEGYIGYDVIDFRLIKTLLDWFNCSGAQPPPRTSSYFVSVLLLCDKRI